MRTRSSTAVNIDFDGASEAWRANKIARPNGTFVYKCNALLYRGCECNLPVVSTKSTCKKHDKKEYKE